MPMTADARIPIVHPAETVRHRDDLARIAAELRHLADEIGVADRIVGRLWPTTADWEDRLRALADRLAPEGGGDG